METIKIELPPPHKALRPNARSATWHRKATATKQYRAAARYAAIAQMNELRWPAPPRWKAATVAVVFSFRSNVRRDKDNLLASLKAAFDGIADSGLVDNDSGLTFLPVEVFYIRNLQRESVILIFTKTE